MSQNHAVDVLSSILAPLRLHGAYQSDWHLHRNWAVQGDPEPRALIHYMIQGTSTVTFSDRTHHHLKAGDLAIFPRGAAHTVGERKRTNAPNINDLLPQRRPGNSSVLSLGDIGTPQRGRMLCAGLDYDHTAEYPLYQMLPDVLILRGEQIGEESLLARLLTSILIEADSPSQGSETMQLRSFELAYLLALRLALTNNLDTPAGRALQHPHLGSALIAINTQYDQPWTIQSLAKLCGLSRSTFAREFSSAIGQTPATHLRTRRLLETRRLLVHTSQSLETIARTVGYCSTIGLHQAFTKTFDLTPGQYRQHHNTEREHLSRARLTNSDA